MCDLLTDPYIEFLRDLHGRLAQPFSPAIAPATPGGVSDHPLDRAVAGDPLSEQAA